MVHPRRRAAAAYALVAALLAALWFFPSIWARGDLYGALVLLVVPALSGWLAGWSVGAPLCDPPPGYGPGRAVMTGAAVSSLAIVLFAILFSLSYVLGPHGSLDALGRGASVLVLAVTALGPIILLAGAAAGLFLYRYSRMSSGRPGESD
jgi:formate hydrogenlyase subunit 4